MRCFAWAWANRDDHDFFVGSKMADPTLNHQYWYRRLLTWGLNALLELMAYHTGSDTHGPKLIRREPIRPHIAHCVIERGQFDTELTLRSVRAGLRIVEGPVLYAEMRKPRNMMLVKILRNLRDVFRLSYAMKSVPHANPIRFRRVAREDLLRDFDASPAQAIPGADEFR